MHQRFLSWRNGEWIEDYEDINLSVPENRVKFLHYLSMAAEEAKVSQLACPSNTHYLRFSL
jgi:hypothetical protein